MPHEPTSGFFTPYSYAVGYLFSPHREVLTPKGLGNLREEPKLHHFAHRQDQAASSAWIGQTLAYTVSMYALICTAFSKVTVKLIPHPITKSQQDALLEEYPSKSKFLQIWKFLQLSQNFGSNLYWHKKGPESKLHPSTPTLEAACMAISIWV